MPREGEGQESGLWATHRSDATPQPNRTCAPSQPHPILLVCRPYRRLRPTPTSPTMGCPESSRSSPTRPRRPRAPLVVRSRPAAAATPLHRPRPRTPTICNSTELQALPPLLPHQPRPRPPASRPAPPPDRAFCKIRGRVHAWGPASTAHACIVPLAYVCGSLTGSVRVIPTWALDSGRDVAIYGIVKLSGLCVRARARAAGDVDRQRPSLDRGPPGGGGAPPSSRGPRAAV